MINYHTPRFKTSEVAQAAGLNPVTLRAYIARGQIEMPSLNRAEADGVGRAATFSLRDALHIAVGASLIRAGADPAKAFFAAFAWAHAGNAKRLPAMLYAEGLTVMIFDNASGEFRVIPFVGKVDPLDFFADDYGASRIIVLLNEVQRDVFAALGVTA
ncbi:MAG: hypothetical protein WBF65_08475 [Sphingopyxis granuli]|uniref:hypothetical protein n=1 Tax=Sphingopyxis granuli TaxID=267128 RepID=UPI003C75CE2A